MAAPHPAERKIFFMEEQKWIETKIEYNVLGEKKYVSKITEELQVKTKTFSKREYVDLLFKVVGLIALVTPFYLTYSQQRNEIKRQRTLYEFELLTEATGLTRQLVAFGFNDSKYLTNANRLFFDLKPKINLLGNKTLDTALQKIEDTYTLIYEISRIRESVDSTQKKILVTARHYINYDDEEKYNDFLDSVYRQHLRFVNNVNLFYDNTELIHELNDDPFIPDIKVEIDTLNFKNDSLRFFKTQFLNPLWELDLYFKSYDYLRYSEAEGFLSKRYVSARYFPNYKLLLNQISDLKYYYGREIQRFQSLVMSSTPYLSK
jgi:hypothetical protein